MGKVRTYRNFTITLESERKDTGWGCKYSVTTWDPQDTRSYGDYTPANFSWEEEAEQVALQNAQGWIDNPPSR